MKTLYKNISSFLFMSALVIGLNTAYASGHETIKEDNAEARELLGSYLREQSVVSAYTTYSFYNAEAELIAEYTLEGNEDNREVNKMLQNSNLLLEEGTTKLYIVE